MQPSSIPKKDPRNADSEFEKLVDALSRALGPTSGLDSDLVDVGVLEDYMKMYQSNESEWKRYAFSDASRGYSRNLVDRGNGKSNLLILVWTLGKGSPIHDHANAHCIMKILKGSLKETRYEWPDGKVSPLPIKQETTFDRGEVTYMSDTLGLHKVSNPDANTFAVSLHLYTPPNAARYGCAIFDEKTGKSSRVSQSKYYSEFGTRV